MTKVYDVIYLPGLGDPRSSEKFLLTIWKFYGIRVYYHPLKWSDNRLFNIKLEEIIDQIDELYMSGHDVSLIGASAGASAAINAFVKRADKVSSLICICGKINNANTISQETLKRNPSFKESLDLLPESLTKLKKSDRKRIRSLHPLRDNVVPIEDTYIDGADNKLLFSLGHSSSILYADTIGSSSIARFIKRHH